MDVLQSLHEQKAERRNASETSNRGSDRSANAPIATPPSRRRLFQRALPARPFQPRQRSGGNGAFHPRHAASNLNRKVAATAMASATMG
jgi:hypothetical protein